MPESEESSDTERGPGETAAAHRDRAWTSFALGLVAVTSLAGLALASSLELQGDEAYFWRWSRFPHVTLYAGTECHASSRRVA
jgi:hypothetical protein